jgi:hypothetical protein
MTAVMRAIAATGPKVLRIGLVQSGRVLEERIIKQRTHVTVGPSEKSMFVVATNNVPANYRLFELIGNDYYLNFLDGMAGRVALQTGISDLAQLKGQARRTPQGAYQIKLTEDSRGKVVIGDTTFLFQFVAPPPVQPKPQLPVAVTRGATSIDWPTTMIAAFAFLLHFLAIGAIYSDWLDPIVDDEVNVAGLIDSMRALPPPPPVEEEKPDADAPTEKAPAETQKAAGGAKPAPGAAGPAKGAMSNAQAAALSKELDQLEMATLGALAAAGPATGNVLRGGDVPTGALDQAAASAAGVGGPGDLKLGGGAGGAIRPGAAGGGLASIGGTGKGAGEGGGAVAAVEGPKGNAAVGKEAVSGGTVSDASRVVARMRAGFRNCYQKGLAQNPDAQGNIRLTIRVGPGGEVSGVSSAPSGNLPPAVVSCVEGRARAAQFSPPEGGAAVIVVPVTFVKQ